MVTIIIIAAGDESRWKSYLGVSKHFIEIEGEQLLPRIVRLFKKYNPSSNIYVVGKTEDYKIKDSTWYLPKLNPKFGDADKFISSMKLWSMSERTIVVYGDVWFSEDAVKQISEYKDKDWILFGRFGKNKLTGGDGGECFAQSFYPEGIEEHHNSLNKIVTAYKHKLLKRNGGWEHYRAMIGFAICPYHIEAGRFYQIEDWTDDFDSPEDYNQWIKARKKWKKNQNTKKLNKK